MKQLLTKTAISMLGGAMLLTGFTGCSESQVPSGSEPGQPQAQCYSVEDKSASEIFDTCLTFTTDIKTLEDTDTYPDRFAIDPYFTVTTELTDDGTEPADSNRTYWFFGHPEINYPDNLTPEAKVCTDCIIAVGIKNTSIDGDELIVDEDSYVVVKLIVEDEGKATELYDLAFNYLLEYYSGAKVYDYRPVANSDTWKSGSNFYQQYISMKPCDTGFEITMRLPITSSYTLTPEY